MSVDRARQDVLTELLRDVREDEATLPVLSTAPFTESGRLWINGERITYTGTTPDTFTGCTRGADQDEGGTEARPHNGGQYVWQDNQVSATTHTHTSGSITDFTEAAQDAALAVIGIGTMIGSPVSFSGATSQAFTSVFTSTYDEYALWLFITSMNTAGADVRLRLRSGTTDDTGATDYQHAGTRVTSAAVTTPFGGNLDGFPLFAAVAGGTGVVGSLAVVRIVHPLDAAIYTSFRSDAVVHHAGVVLTNNSVGGLRVVANSRDGILVYPSGGLFTGVGILFGIRKS